MTFVASFSTYLISCCKSVQQLVLPLSLLSMSSVVSLNFNFYDNRNFITRMLLFKGTCWYILTFYTPFLPIVTMVRHCFIKRTWWWWWWFRPKPSPIAAALCLKVISKLHKACQLYDEWKLDNRPTFKPWLYPEQSPLPLLNTNDIVTMKYSTTCADLLSESGATEDEVSDVESWDGFWDAPRLVVIFDVFVVVFRCVVMTGKKVCKWKMCDKRLG